MLQRLIRAYRRHNLAEIPSLIVKNMRHAWERRNEPATVAASDFDSRYQVETDNIRETGSLDIDSPNAKHAVRYEPSPADMVRSILAKLDLDWPRFTFIDFGAGKGRVLLLAAELPFKSIIGIEFSPELAGQANQNIANHQGPANAGKRISCECMDVVDFKFPSGSLVCYFYNPFGYPVLEKVLANMLSAPADPGHETYMVYVHPVYRDAIERERSVFVPILEENDVVVYRVNRHTAEN